MVIKTVNLETVAGITSKLPKHSRPEFAFAGKSNVGKSTLINGLMNRKAYARTSSKPGKTQTINYYSINDQFYLVDLPGYGYATAGPAVKKQWAVMIEDYLYQSKSLKAVFLLIDIRHKPGAEDQQMFDWILHAGFDPYIIATKADKINRSQLAGQVRMIRESLMENSAVWGSPGYEDVPEIRVLPYAGLTKNGREEIYGLLDELLVDKGLSD